MCPGLGVVVPHYNQYETLFDSIDSINQSSVRKKIVIVDDGSNFRPPRELASFKPIPDHVTIMGFVDNHGVQVARNTGITYLLRFGCEFTLFSDSDVIWAPRALDKMVGVLNLKTTGKNVSYAYCDWNWGGKDHISGPFDADRLRETNYISTMSVIRTSDLLKYVGAFAFDESLSRLQDWDIWLTFLKAGQEGIYIPECLFNTQFSETGISNGPGYQEAVNAITKKHHLK